MSSVVNADGSGGGRGSGGGGWHQPCHPCQKVTEGPRKGKYVHVQVQFSKLGEQRGTLWPDESITKETFSLRRIEL